MRLRELAALILPLAVLACGSNSTPTAPTPTVLDVVPGSYALTITMSSSGEPVCNNGICASVSLCGGLSGAAPSVRALTAVVRLDRSEDAITIRPADGSASFRMELRIVSTVVSGIASGEIRDPTLQVSLRIGSGQPGQSAAVATGTVMTTSIVGKLDGQLGVGGYSCSNNGHTWTLFPL
jgi:hypothetical protein